MTYTTSVILLVLAAALEAGGDALVRAGLRAPSWEARAGLFAIGGLVLFLYGCAVNAPPWDFGKLLGVYVVFFFLVAQIIAWTAFGTPPTTRILLGGALIVAGGVIVSGP